jgi:hypothetical protein
MTGSGKEIARKIFHRGARRLLHLPGGRLVAGLARSIAPGAAEWLALRYRAYDRGAYDQGAATPLAPVRAGVGQAASLDLSEEEARILRQFAVAGPDAARP